MAEAEVAVAATLASNRSIGVGHQLEPKLAVNWPSSGVQMMELRTLGTLSLLGADGAELQTVLVQPKRVALLTHLAVSSRMGLVRRDPLLGLFWPEHDESRARASLRQALYEFRQELGQEVLVTRGDDEVGLNSELFWCDVPAFEAALAAGDLELAVSLYRGSFLAGFSLRGSVEFDQWLEVERDRLGRAFAGALERLAESASERGEAQQAAEWWRRLVEHDPYATRGVVRLMEALESAGDRAGALEQADRHAARMLAVLDAEPSPDVVALAERLRRQPVAREKTLVQPTEVQQTADRADRLRAGAVPPHSALTSQPVRQSSYRAAVQDVVSLCRPPSRAPKPKGGVYAPSCTFRTVSGLSGRLPTCHDRIDRGTEGRRCRHRETVGGHLFRGLRSIGFRSRDGPICL